jgi:hypothetical protein
VEQTGASPVRAVVIPATTTPDGPARSPLRRALGAAAVGFVLSRIVVYGGLWFGARFVAQAPGLPDTVGPFASLWRWDAGYYLAIAARGYEFAADGQAHNVAFFPLLPLCLRLLGAVTRGADPVVLGVLLVHACFFAALVQLHRYVEEQHPDVPAGDAVLFASAYPLGVFTASIYTESLFLLLAVTAYRSFLRARYGRAAVATALLSATRVPGAFVLASLLGARLIARVPAPLARPWPRALGWLAAMGVGGSAGLLAHLVYLRARFGRWDVFVAVQQGWGNVTTRTKLWTQIRHFDVFAPAPTGYGVVPPLWDLVPALVLVGLVGYLAVRRAYRPYAIWAALIAWALWTMGTFYSHGRFVLVFFPLHILLAETFARRPVARACLLALMAAWLFIAAVLFTRWYAVI